MPRPLTATIHLDSMQHNLARRARLRARRQGLGGGQGQRLWPRAGARHARLRRRRRPGADRDRERACACASWAGPARSCCWKAFSTRPTWRCWPQYQLHSAVHCDRADRDAGAGRADRPDRCPSENEHRHEPARLHAARISPPPMRACAPFPAVRNITLMTHFANADELEHPRLTVREQVRALSAAAPQGLAGQRSLSNSGGVLHQAALADELANDWVRPGIMLYGGTPGRQERRTIRPAPDHDAGAARSSACRTWARRHGRLRQPLRGRRADAGRRRGLRLCRRLSAPCAARHAGAGRRRAHHAGRARVDGHDDGRPDAQSRTRGSAAR